MADALCGTHTAVRPYSLTGTVQRKHTTHVGEERDARCTTLVRLLRVVVVVTVVVAVRQSCLLCWCFVALRFALRSLGAFVAD